MAKEKKKENVEDHKEMLLRTQANFENYKKQVEKRQVEFEMFAKMKVISKILPIFEHLDLALKTNPENTEFYKGVEMISTLAQKTLEELGLKHIKTVGEVFDPKKHEAISKVESDKEENIILEEISKGYEMNDKVIKTSKVKVSGGIKNE